MLHDLIVWLFVSYSCAVLIALVSARVVDGKRLHRESSPQLVKLLLHQSAGQLEAVVRSLAFASRWQGKPILILLADQGSTDDTLKIISILLRNHFLVTVEECAEEPAYILDLRTPYSQ